MPDRGWCVSLHHVLDIAASIVLLPVLIEQALYVRRNIAQLPEPQGARRGTSGSGPNLRILILGESSAVGLGVDTQAEALLGQIIQALNPQFTLTYGLVAVIGARTVDSLGWLFDLPAERYDVVVTAFGVNDVTKGTSLRRFLGLQDRLIARLQSERHAKLIVVSGLPPVNEFPALPQPLRWVLGRQAHRFDQALHLLVTPRKGCAALVFDMALDTSKMSRDGFHPRPVVYAAWAKNVARVVHAHAPFA
ncbi:MAG: lysophospholipase L1-like esterase [Yoonia sp.]